MAGLGPGREAADDLGHHRVAQKWEWVEAHDAAEEGAAADGAIL